MHVKLLMPSIQRPETTKLFQCIRENLVMTLVFDPTPTTRTEGGEKAILTLPAREPKSFVNDNQAL